MRGRMPVRDCRLTRLHLLRDIHDLRLRSNGREERIIRIQRHRVLLPASDGTHVRSRAPANGAVKRRATTLRCRCRHLLVAIGATMRSPWSWWTDGALIQLPRCLIGETEPRTNDAEGQAFGITHLADIGISMAV